MKKKGRARGSSPAQPQPEPTVVVVDVAEEPLVERLAVGPRVVEMGGGIKDEELELTAQLLQVIRTREYVARYGSERGVFLLPSSVSQKVAIMEAMLAHGSRQRLCCYEDRKSTRLNSSH